MEKEEAFHCGSNIQLEDWSRKKFKNLNLHQSGWEGIVFSQATISGVNFQGTKIEDADLSDVEVDGAQIGGAYFRNIGLPPEDHPAHNPEKSKQRPVRFENCDLNDSTITGCNLTNLEISNCDISGMRINGILVEDILKQYK